ncbi:MAG TPA: PDZ domain-containing protein [Candidatus Angelobacter sp.]|nr:PDZ domain-containing protein [Candidatus Angelobacter sp.]
MTRMMTTALLLAGLTLPAFSADEMQPDTLSKHVSGFFYAAGRSYLGVDIKDVTADRVRALKLKDERGVEITMVDADAPAGKAGLREHDVILEFNGTAVESEEQLRRLIRETPPGRTVALGISRDGAPMKVNVQLADHSAVVAQSWPHVAIPSLPPMGDLHNGMDIPSIQIQTYSSVLGAQTENLTRQLGEYFGVKDGEGILIRSVEKGSAAEKGGLKAGDVIIKADNEKLNDRSDLTHILRSHRKGGKLNLVVMRDKKEQTIVVTLPDRSSRDSSWLVLDPEEWQAAFNSSAAYLDNLRINDEVFALKSKLKAMQPQTEKAMRDAARELERSKRLLQDLVRNSDFI